MAEDPGQLGLHWQELIDATGFAAERFAVWRREGKIGAQQGDAIALEYYMLHNAWVPAARAGKPLPTEVRMPPGRLAANEDQREYRFWYFVGQEINRHAAAGRLTLSQKHGCLGEVKERLAAIRRRGHGEAAEVVVAEVVHEPAAKATPVPTKAAADATGSEPRPKHPVKSRRNVLEMLLEPRTIQCLLAFGGTLIVVGLVILLWVNEYFTPPVVAIVMGAANAAVLAGGFAVLRYTRFHTAGKAITLLACLVMPLNLWYYNANDLITIDGHLWLAAVAISVLYAASALLLEDEMFVYVFVGGVALTGLLILADLPPSPQHFWEIASPAAMLVCFGLLAIHAERAYPDIEGPFGRKRFGLAFFWSGHVLLAAGLLLVLGAQIAGNWLYEPVFRPIFARYDSQPSPIVGELRWLAFALVLAGTYAYIYSDVVVRRLGVYVHVAALTLIWSEVLLVELLDLRLGVDALIAVFAVTSLVINLFEATITRGKRITRAIPMLGLLLGVLPVLLGMWVYGRALSAEFNEVWGDQPPSWSYVGAMVLAAVSCRVGAHVYRRDLPRLAASYFFATAAATMVAAVALLAALGRTQWPQHAPWLMLIPIVYVVAAHFYRGHSPEQPLLWVSHAAAAVMLVSSLASALRGFTVVQQQPLNLSLALFFAEAAAFYGLAAVFHKQPFAVHLGTLMACGTVWQVLAYAGVRGEYYTLVFALLGLALLVGYRFAMLKPLATGGLADAAFQCANTLLSLALVSAFMMGMSRLTTRDVEWRFIGLCVVLTLLSLVAAGLVREANWRRWYVVTSIAQALLVFLCIQILSHLSGWQKLEIFSVVVGVLLLVVGHIGWYYEQDRENDLVTSSLFLGSLLATLPLAIATLIDRSQGNFSGFLVLNELGFLTISIALVTSGIVFQLKSTALCGAVSTTLYFVTLLIYVPWSRLNTVAVAIIVGGGVLFGAGLLLSLYRDRLLTLPDRIKSRQGIFRVLSWR